MADFEFQIKKEGTVYDWPQVIGRAPGLYDEEEGAAASERFKELPFEKKKQLYDAWVPEMRSSLKAVGAEDLTPFENYVENERGFLEEMDAFENPPPDTLSQDLSAAAGKTIQGIGDRLSFLGTDTATSALTDPLQMQRRLAQRLPNQPQEQGVSFADMIQGDLQQAAGGLEIMGQTIQDASGAREESKTFQPGNHKWWLEKGVPTLGGLLVDLGLASVSGGAAPFAFAASAGSQMGGSVLNESRAAYQEDAKKKYDARLQAGEAVAEARTQLRGELQQADKKAEAEAVLIGSVSAVLNTVPGMTMTRPLGVKIKEIAIRKGIPAFVAKFGMSAVAEGVTEILDELAQDGGRIGRDIGDLKSRMEAWKQSEPGQRYLAAGTLGAVMGAGVDVVSNLTKSKKADLQERVNEAAPVEPPGPAPVSEPSTAPETPTATPESATEAPVEAEAPAPNSEELLARYKADREALVAQREPYLPNTTPRRALDDQIAELDDLIDALEPAAPTAVISREAEIAAVPDGTPIRYKKDIAKGATISWLTPLGTVESGVVKNRDKDTITFEGGRTKSFRPGRLFSGLLTPKENTANMAIGDVLSTGDALYQYVGDGLFNVGSRFNGEIVFDRDSRDPLGKDIINDPRTALYSREAFDGAAESYNSRPDPKKTDTFSPYLEQIGEKPHDQARTASPEASGQAQPATGEGSPVSQVPGQEAGPQEVQAAVAAEASSTPPIEEASLSQLRTELTRRARLDRGKDNRVQEAQIENLVQVIDASATALASRTGRSKADILARISFSHDKPAGTRTPNDMAGEYDAINRIIRLYPKTNATTVVHEWMHFVLEEHVYNLDEDMNILNREERKILEAYARQKIPTGKLKEGLLRSGAKPSKVYHEFMADLMEHMFQSRYQSGNKPSGMPDQIFNLLKKVGDFIRQVYSKIRYNWTSTEFDGSANEETVLNLMDRIFVPEQIETMVNQASAPPDVVLPQPDLNDAPDVNRMFEDMKAMSHSQTKTPITPSSYQDLDRLEAEGRLGQTVPQEEQQAPDEAPTRRNGYFQPMLAQREFERSVNDGIDDFVKLMEDSVYQRIPREATKRAARDFLGKMSTGEAIATIMGDPNTDFAKIQGEMPAAVYVASAMILANRLRADLASGVLQQAVAEGRLPTNKALEMASVYETYLKYFVETIAPGAGRSVDILNEYRKPTSSRDRVQRVFGLLDATSTHMVEQAKNRLGEDRMAWIRSYAFRQTEGAVTEENFKRRKREFLQEFQAAYPPEQRPYFRAAMNTVTGTKAFLTQEENDAFKLYQTILDNPNGNIPGTAIRAFGRNYNFQDPVWRNVEALTIAMDTLPPDSLIRDKIQSEVVALLASDAGIPMGALISSHFMAQYLCAPSTTVMSLVGNAMTMTSRIGAFLVGFSREPIGARLNNADQTPYIVRGNRINPNLRYLPRMLQSLWQNYRFPTQGDPNAGAVWRNILSSLQGFGPGTRLNTGHLSASEIYDSAIRYNHPSGRMENLGDITKQVHSLLMNAPARLMSVADAAVGTGTKGLTSAVASAQVAHWNALNYRRELEANPALLPAAFGNINEAVRAFRNSEYTRLSGNDPVQMAGAMTAAVNQVNTVLSDPALARSKLSDNFNRQTMVWMAYRQMMDQIRQQEMASAANLPEIDVAAATTRVRQDAAAHGIVLTPTDEARLVAAAVAAEEANFQQANTTNYQQEIEFDQATAAFTYMPKGHTGRIIRLLEQAIGSIALQAGRIGARHIVTPQGTLAEEGGLNIGGVTSQAIFPFLRAAALGAVYTIQFSPLGWIAVANRGPIGGRGTWTQAEMNTFAMMSLLGTIGLAAFALKHWDDEDPLEEGKDHIIGSIPTNDWGRRLKARGIEPYTEYRINSDGSVFKKKLNTIQGPTTSPLLWIGAFNSVRWNNMNAGKERDMMQTAFESSLLFGKTMGMSGPLGTFAKYGSELNDRKFVDIENIGASGAMNTLKNLGMDGILPYRRAFNEVGALVNNAGIAAGMNWEPDTKNLPATMNGQTAVNTLKTFTNDYLVFSDISSRPALNGFGEPLVEDANLLRKVATVTPKTPMNDLLAEYGLALAPMSQYKTPIRKGDSKEMKELFAQVGKQRSDTLPAHLVGNLKNEEVYEYLGEFYNPLLMKTVGEILKGDPYKNPQIEELIAEAMEQPGANPADTDTIKRAILQKHIESIRSNVEAISMAQYFAAKNPDLDSDFVADYVTDLVEASGEG